MKLKLYFTYVYIIFFDIVYILNFLQKSNY